MTEESQEMSESFFEMKYLSEIGLFELAWYDRPNEEDKESRKYFSVRLLPETFQQMSSDMLKMVKDFNLKQALEYQEKIDGSGRIGDLRIESATCGGTPEVKLEHSEKENIGAEESSKESKEDQRGTTGETEEVIQEV